ncbi:cytochrome O ubiquinol oxidase subunit I [Candidatus Carsonella ruddii HT isolate Thao2000]|uniref:Cytochrome O ubiquinol oxidase subunit I n=1 Tax=Candidatus Carsonella ruddii HT isolate Thao2000 TaxID=1202539 RepID=J3VQH6_CARRU|nr:cbb3-type cytochrome c oxidase subunit I [Candidatus Carsonella ruddii]AFP84216.1 cytochrome O ubiquinol oxidase subunit I [Candidatus Carsonella ruddii HT isolate Thao2000]
MIFGRLNYNSIPIRENIINFLFFIIIIIIIIILPFLNAFKKKIKSYLTSYDHKKIGKLYLFISFIMLIRGFTDALMMRLQQILSYNHYGYLSSNHYSQIFTAHGVIMIFFVAMPFMIGIMNIIIPLQIGAIDVIFPSLNLLSFWMTFFSIILINISLIFGEFSKIGWLSYPPLSEITFSPWVGVDYWIWSLQISGVSTLITSINFITTIIKCRKKNLFFFKLPIFIWTCFCSNILILVSFPILNILITMLFLDRNFNFHFFSAFYGGQQILYLNLIWAWGHPEVYILILPSFGIFTEILSNICKKTIFAYNSLIYATISITILSFIVWLHHFFTMGSGFSTNIFFSISTMIIAIPTGVKIFNWIFTILFSKNKISPLFCWFLSFIIIFSIGGFSGVILSIPNLDFIFHNSMFLIAHFHSVIIGGVLFGYLAGINYWFPIIFNKQNYNFLIYINIILWFIGVITTFFPFFLLGYLGMYRRSNFFFNLKWIILLKISFFGSLLILISILLQIINFFLNKKNLNLNNYEQLFINNHILKNENFLYKKYFLKNYFFKIKHEKSIFPFIISLFLFLFAFFIIWWMWDFVIITLFFLIILIILYIYE